MLVKLTTAHAFKKYFSESNKLGFMSILKKYFSFTAYVCKC